MLTYKTLTNIVKESRTKMRRGNFHTCLMTTKNEQYKNNKRNVNTYTAYLVTTNTETGTITHETLKEYGSQSETTIITCL